MSALQAWALALAGVLTALLTPLLRAWLLQRGLVDQPGARRSHVQPTPRGGGAAMVGAMAMVLLGLGGVDALATVGVLLALAAIGWLDDIRDLPVRWRLAGHFVIALGMLWLAGPVAEVAIGSTVLASPLLWSALAVVAVVWLINLHNFMDGSDGLAAVQALWAGLMLGLLVFDEQAPVTGLAGLALAGAGLGFLAWNRPPARIFMGDVGSVSIGGLVGLLALSGAASGRVSIWLSLIICSLFVVDATATLLRRAASGARWYTPHREHAYQRLIGLGWSHGRVLALYALINLVLVLPVAQLALRFPDWEMPLALALVLILSGGWYVVQRVTNKENNTQ